MPPLISRVCPAVLSQRFAYKVFLMTLESFRRINLGLVGQSKCLTMTIMFQDGTC
jgi:hypothetical protein